MGESCSTGARGEREARGRIEGAAVRVLPNRKCRPHRAGIRVYDCHHLVVAAANEDAPLCGVHPEASRSLAGRDRIGIFDGESL